MQCSPVLRQLLEREAVVPDAVSRVTFEVASEIARKPELLAEASALVGVLDDALQPAAPEALGALLVSKGPHYGLNVHEGSPEEWAMRWASYREALADLPLCAVEAAFVAWDRPTDPKAASASGFYPRAGQLYALAKAERDRLGLIRYRALKATERAEHKPPPKRERMSRQEMIDAGFIREDGSVPGLKGSMNNAVSALARAVIGEEDAAARQAGAPISRHHIHDEPPETV